MYNVYNVTYASTYKGSPKGSPTTSYAAIAPRWSHSNYTWVNIVGNPELRKDVINFETKEAAEAFLGRHFLKHPHTDIICYSIVPSKIERRKGERRDNNLLRIRTDRRSYPQPRYDPQDRRKGYGRRMFRSERRIS